MSGMNVIVDRLAQIANDPSEDEAVRVAAVDGLGNVESQYGRSEARNALSDILDDPKKTLPVRAAAARAIGRLA